MAPPMKSFENRFAVTTGGGSGMGRHLVIQLAAEGCSVAFCDVIKESIDETIKLAMATAKGGAKVSGHVCDTSKEAEVLRFREEALKAHGKTQINLLFNNAGIGGGGSFVKDSREAWDRTFNIDWHGVYLCTRAFLPDMLKADAAWLINTSSINGFHGVLGIGNGVPHTAYSTAKFAVKGFSESLLVDFRHNAPHIGVSVVMPGHVGSKIIQNSGQILGGHGVIAGVEANAEFAKNFEESAPLTPAQAATIILDGVRAGKWRILVGKDAELFDRLVRENPESAYNEEFFDEIRKAGAGVNVTGVNTLDEKAK